MGFDGPVVLKGEFSANKQPSELSGFYVDGLNVAGHLISRLVPEDNLQNALRCPSVGVAGQHHEVGPDGDRRWARGGEGEVNSSEVNSC